MVANVAGESSRWEQEQVFVQLSDFDTTQNLVELFFKRADEHGDRPFLGAKRDGNWTTQSWREVAEQVSVLAESLRAIGLQAGERVMLVSENRPEWCIADLAIMAAGCITVPAYTTNTQRDHMHILDNSGAKAVIVSNEKLSDPLLPAIMRTRHRHRFDPPTPGRRRRNRTSLGGPS
jgi:long-chain acyl-CoA synthetase